MEHIGLVFEHACAIVTEDTVSVAKLHIESVNTEYRCPVYLWHQCIEFLERFDTDRKGEGFGTRFKKESFAVLCIFTIESEVVALGNSTVAYAVDRHQIGDFDLIVAIICLRIVGVIHRQREGGFGALFAVDVEEGFECRTRRRRKFDI
ncbi:hypothetical protein D1872_285630 [compost metagenome]